MWFVKSDDKKKKLPVFHRYSLVSFCCWLFTAFATPAVFSTDWKWKQSKRPRKKIPSLTSWIKVLYLYTLLINQQYSSNFLFLLACFRCTTFRPDTFGTKKVPIYQQYCRQWHNCCVSTWKPIAQQSQKWLTVLSNVINAIHNPHQHQLLNDRHCTCCCWLFWWSLNNL